MENKPQVSVIIPVYCHSDKHAGYLKETLESVAVQTYRPVELIIIDDVSPIDISPIIDSIPNLPPVRIFRHPTSQGHAKSRNEGIMESTCDYIAFLDHDDIWIPDKLQKQIKAFENNPDAGAVFCDVEVFGDRTKVGNIDQSITPERPDFVWFVYHGNYTISATAVMVKKQAMLDIGLFDPRYTTTDDFDAWLKILMKEPIIHIPEQLARYRMHTQNTSYSLDRFNDSVLLTSLVLRYFKSASAKEKTLLLPRIMRKFMGIMLAFVLRLVKGSKKSR